MSWRVFHRDADLPASVVEAALDVARRGGKSPAWKLLRSGNTRRIYRYDDAASGSAWVIKWGRNHPISDWSRGLRGPNDAEAEFAVARDAHAAGLPAIPYALAASTPRWIPPLRTLLVAPFAEGVRDLTTALQFAWNDEAETNRLLDAAGALAARVHKAGFVHQDFSGSNLLVQPSGELLLIDWLKATRPSDPPPSGNHRADLVRGGADLLYAGLRPEKIDRLVDAYLDAFEVDEATRADWRRVTREKAILKRRKIAERAYANAFKGSREVEVAKLAGGEALVFKGADAAIVEEWQQGRGRVRLPSNSDAVESQREAWRVACALERAGLRGHRAIAYAAPPDERVVRRVEGGTPLAQAFADSKLRDKAIAAVADHCARAMTLRFGIRPGGKNGGIEKPGFVLERWRLVEAPGGRPELEADWPGQWDFPLPPIERQEDEAPYWAWLDEWLATEDAASVGLGPNDASLFKG